MSLINTQRYSKNVTLFKTASGAYEMEPPKNKIIRDDGFKYPAVLNIIRGRLTQSEYPILFTLQHEADGKNLHYYLYRWPVKIVTQSVIDALVGTQLRIETILEEPITIPTSRGPFELSSRMDLFADPLGNEYY